MHWIIQDNLFNETEYQCFLDTVVKLELPHTLVKVIPFSHDLEPVPDVQNPIAVMGSTTLVRIAQKYGWGPGVFFNDNFTFERWRENWGPELLNYDSEICRFEDVKFEGKRFIRPVDDLKVFCGGVVVDELFDEWKEKVLRYDDGTVNSNTLVTVASPKVIYSEYRFFVVSGRVVTGSRYKLGDRVVTSTEIPPEIASYAQAMVDIWQPDRGFVIDVAQTEDGMRIVEVNNLNSSGFYKSDTSKLVQAIESILA